MPSTTSDQPVSQSVASLPIRVGVAGLGRAGFSMQCKELATLGDSFTLAAACDPYEAARQRFEEAYPEAKAYQTLDDLCDDVDLDLISIATRSTDHIAHARQALRSGKHVVVDKPMAVELADAEALAKEVQSGQYPGQCFVRHNRRFEPGLVAIQDILTQGLLGEVHTARLRRHNYQRRSDWQSLRDQGGGQLLNWGPHLIDHALVLLGGPADSQWSCLKRLTTVGDAEDHVHLCMERSGLTVDLEISGGVNRPEPEYAVYGTRGSLICTGTSLSLKHLPLDFEFTALDANPGQPVDGYGKPDELTWIEETRELPGGSDFNLEYWREVAATLTGQAEFPIPLDHALEVMRVVERARQSAMPSSSPSQTA